MSLWRHQSIFALLLLFPNRLLNNRFVFLTTPTGIRASSRRRRERRCQTPPVFLKHDLYVGGSFSIAGTNEIHNSPAWDGAQLARRRRRPDGPVYAP